MISHSRVTRCETSSTLEYPLMAAPRALSLSIKAITRFPDNWDPNVSNAATIARSSIWAIWVFRGSQVSMISWLTFDENTIASFRHLVKITPPTLGGLDWSLSNGPGVNPSVQMIASAGPPILFGIGRGDPSRRIDLQRSNACLIGPSTVRFFLEIGVENRLRNPSRRVDAILSFT